MSLPSSLARLRLVVEVWLTHSCSLNPDGSVAKYQSSLSEKDTDSAEGDPTLSHMHIDRAILCPLFFNCPLSTLKEEQ